MQFKPTTDEQWVIRSLLDAQEALVINTDFIIEEDPDGMPTADTFCMWCLVTADKAVEKVW